MEHKRHKFPDFQLYHIIFFLAFTVEKVSMVLQESLKALEQLSLPGLKAPSAPTERR